MENYGNPLDVGIFPKLFRAAQPRKVYKIYMVLSACINDWCPCWALMPRMPWPSYRGAMQDAVRRWWRWGLKRSLLQQAIMGNSPNTGRLFFLTITFGFTALKHRCGDGSKLWYLVNPKIAGKWMFIPLNMYLKVLTHTHVIDVDHCGSRSTNQPVTRVQAPGTVSQPGRGWWWMERFRRPTDGLRCSAVLGRVGMVWDKLGHTVHTFRWLQNPTESHHNFEEIMCWDMGMGQYL